MKSPLKDSEPLKKKRTTRDVRKLIKDKEKTELTTYRGKYHLLHIANNGVPVPLMISKNLDEIENEILVRGF